MPPFTDLTGKRFGFLVITKLSETPYKDGKGKKYNKWEWKCDCGVTGCSLSPNIVKSNKKFKTSCGCNSGGARETLILFNRGYKICGACKNTLTLDQFHKSKFTSTKLSSMCKVCKLKSDQKYAKDPKVRDRILKNKHEYYHTKYKGSELHKIYTERRRLRRDWKAEYEKEQNDPLRRSKSAIRKLILYAFKQRGKTKHNKSTEQILGCSFSFFESYIQSQFADKMTWLNHGEWHLDHKVPLSCAKTEEELLKLNHYSNFQPLWAKENLTKHNVLLKEHYNLHKTLLGREVDVSYLNGEEVI